MNIRYNCSNLLKVMNSKNKELIIKTFEAAYKENSDQALAILFYARSLFGGGMRYTPLVILKYIFANKNIDNNLMNKIIKYGSFKDLRDLYTIATDLNKLRIIYFWVDKLQSKYKPAFKWVPRKGVLFYKLANKMKMKNGTFRRFLTRNYTSLETRICKKQWGKIVLSKVSQKAIYHHNKVLSKHFKLRFLC